jgi:hypothetical protein
MAANVTALSNIIVPAVFAPYMLEQSLVKNALIQSGVISRNPLLDEKLAGGGLSFNLPSWKPLDANGTSANVPTDDNTVLATPEAIIARENLAIRVDRNKLFGATDIVRSIAGSDPMAAVGAYVGLAINQWRQASLLKTLQGTVNATNLSSNVNSVAVETTASYTSATRINSGTVVDTLSAMGDFATNMDGYAIFMHSDTYRYLIKNDFTSFQRQSFQNFGLGQNGVDGASAPGMQQYLGMQVIVDDTLPKVAGSTSGFKYTTYIIKPGAISFGFAPALNPVEVQRMVREGNGAGAEYLAARDTYCYHVNGFKWVGTAAGIVPTDTELGTAGNWSAVFTGKGIGVTALVHNAA